MIEILEKEEFHVFAALSAFEGHADGFPRTGKAFAASRCLLSLAVVDGNEYSVFVKGETLWWVLQESIKAINGHDIQELSLSDYDKKMIV